MRCPMRGRVRRPWPARSGGDPPDRTAPDPAPAGVQPARRP